MHHFFDDMQLLADLLIDFDEPKWVTSTPLINRQEANMVNV